MFCLLFNHGKNTDLYIRRVFVEFCVISNVISPGGQRKIFSRVAQSEAKILCF